MIILTLLRKFFVFKLHFHGFLMNLSSASTKKSPLGAAGRQSGSTKNSGAATGVTRDPSWEPKISKKPWENKDFQKIKKKTLFCFAQTDNVKIELWCR